MREAAAMKLGKAGEFARLSVVLSGGLMGALVQLAILPSLTHMADAFAGQAGGMLDGPSIAQLITTMAVPTMILGAPIVGRLAERYGKRRTLLISAVVYAMSGAAGALVSDLWSLLATRLILGMASAGFSTVATGLIADFYPRERREQLISGSALLATGGALLSLVVAGGLAELSWRAPFLLYLIGLAIFAAGYRVIEEPRRLTLVRSNSEDESVAKASRLLVLTILISMFMYMGSVQGPFLLASRGIVSPSTQAIFAIIITLGAVGGAYTVGLLLPRLKFAITLGLLWLSLGAGILGIGLSSNPFALFAFGALSGFGGGLMAPLIQSAIINAVPASAATRAIGLSLGSIFLGQFIQPFVMAPLRSLLGVQEMFVWVGSAGLGLALLTILGATRVGVGSVPSA